MIPHGEAGLIFAGSGPAAGVFDAALVTVVMASICMVPSWRKALYGARR
jgi:hypothetical protein